MNAAHSFLKTDTPRKLDPEDILLRVTEAERTVSALSNVLNFIVTDAFCLTAEESIWVSRLLHNALEPLKKIIPSATLGAVKQEMLTGSYSLRMFQKNSTPEFTLDDISDPYGKNVQQATATDWTEGICQIIFDSYPDLRPAIKSRIIGSVHGVFEELGVTDNLKKTRKARYLPTTIRYVINAE